MTPAPFYEFEDEPFGCTPLVWLKKKEYLLLADMPPRTCSRMAREGRIWGTAGRAEGYHADPWPILLCPRLRKEIQDRLDWKRRQKVQKERKATGAKLTRLPSITDAVDTIEVELGKMAERKVHSRLSGQDIMRLEKELRRGRAKLATYHNAVLERMTAAGIAPLPDMA